MADVVLESVHGDPKEITRNILLAKEHMARRAKMHRRFEQVSKTEAFTSALGKDVSIILSELNDAEKWLVQSGEAIVGLLRVLAEELHPHVGKEELSVEDKRAHIREITAKVPPILEKGGIADEITTKIHRELDDVHSRLIAAFVAANPKHKEATEKALAEMKELDKQYEMELAALNMGLLLSPEATASAPPAVSLLLLPGCESLGVNLFAHGFVPHVRPETDAGQAAKRLGEVVHKKTLLEVGIAKVDQEVDDQSAKYLDISEAVLSLYAQVLGHERFIRHLAAHLMVLEMEEHAPGDHLLAEHAKESEERIAQNNAFIELFTDYVNDVKQGMTA